MNLRNIKGKPRVSPDPLEVSGKISGENQELKETSNVFNGSEFLNSDPDEMDLNNLDRYPENPYEETGEDDDTIKAEKKQERIEKKEK